MTRRHLRLWGVLVLFGAASFAAGCGDDEENCTRPIVLDIRDGMWEVVDSLRHVAADTACFGDSVSLDSTYAAIDTLIFCEMALPDDPEVTDLCCENNVNGNNVDLTCRVTYPLDVCQLVFEVTTVGTITDTTFDLTFRYLDTISGPSNPCVFFDGYQDTCLQEIHTVGRWISAEGDTCGSMVLTGEDVLRKVLARSRGLVTR